MASEFKFYVHYDPEPSFTHKYVWDKTSLQTVESLIKVQYSLETLPILTSHLLQITMTQMGLYWLSITEDCKLHWRGMPRWFTV